MLTFFVYGSLLTDMENSDMLEDVELERIPGRFPMYAYLYSIHDHFPALYPCVQGYSVYGEYVRIRSGEETKATERLDYLENVNSGMYERIPIHSALLPADTIYTYVVGPDLIRSCKKVIKPQAGNAVLWTQYYRAINSLVFYSPI